jgi:flagellar assembly protein FliH
LSPNTLPFGRRIVAAADSISFARAPIASRILPPPIVVGPTREDEIEAQIAAARAEGYEAGRQDVLAGPAVETDRARAEATVGLLASITTATEALVLDRNRLVDEMTAEVADLALAVVEVILGANLAGQDELRNALERALAIAPENEPITIRIHPAASIDPEELASLVTTDDVTIVADPTVDPHGCVVEAGASRIDAQISTVIGRVERVFDTLRSHSSDGRRTVRS